ncbi:MAG: hypothetical protein CMH30_08910 [Micavibrio sp.]|nr:hypothetical protein [Micavibrio sp.]|tara:strand:+ start:537 stop:1097 length:561 start_codon:yes stop_codon:yes gene_type:complete
MSDEVDNSVKKSRLAVMFEAFDMFWQRLKTDRATQIVTALVTIVVLGLYFVISSLLYVPHGEWRYGACKVVIEELAEYPSSVDILASGETPNSATIYYSRRNSFGDERLHLIYCLFDIKDGRPYIKSVAQDGKDLPKAAYKNVSDYLPFILQTDMDTQTPEGYNTDIEAAKDRKMLPLDPSFSYER